MLSSHLKKAVERFEIESSSIAPICEVDAKIIDALIDIFSKIYYYDLKKVFDEYKKVPDEETLYKLKMWLQNGSAASKMIIKLGEEELNLQFFQSISLVDSYDTKMRCPIYKIIINRDETEKMLFSNHEVVFYTEKSRDEALKDFKERTKYLQIRYI
jgi:hypothetical protein